MNAAAPAAVAQAISQATSDPFQPDYTETAGGGSINRTLVLAEGERRYFVKLNQAFRHDMFSAEAEGLAALAETRTVRVPAPICRGTAGDQAFLVLEYLQLAPAGAGQAEILGAQLAQLHRHSAERYGWERDNTLGTTPQPNAWRADWIAFLREQRLAHQLKLLGDEELSALGGRLLDGLPCLFTGYQPTPSLIHGDLWGGNWGATETGAPVIYDPACYYADREMELAMTELFGGFPAAFYAAYNDAWPLDEGYSRRKCLYLLYHVLNHANLFGGGYRDQAKQLMVELLDRVRSLG